MVVYKISFFFCGTSSFCLLVTCQEEGQGRREIDDIVNGLGLGMELRKALLITLASIGVAFMDAPTGTLATKRNILNQIFRQFLDFLLNICNTCVCINNNAEDRFGLLPFVGWYFKLSRGNTLQANKIFSLSDGISLPRCQHLREFAKAHTVCWNQ